MLALRGNLISDFVFENSRIEIGNSPFVQAHDFRPFFLNTRIFLIQRFNKITTKRSQFCGSFGLVSFLPLPEVYQGKLKGVIPVTANHCENLAAISNGLVFVCWVALPLTKKNDNGKHGTTTSSVISICT